MMVCCFGRGMADVFAAFVKDCEVFEVMEPWTTQHSPDVLTSLVRFLSVKGVGRFDLIARDVADGSSEHQWQCLAHLGAGLGVSPRIFHIQDLHDRAAQFIGLSGVCCAIGGRGLNIYPPARDPRKSSSLERAACGPFGLREFTLRLHLLHSVSRGWNASEGVGATDAWRQICALPRALRRRLRHFRWPEQVETEGGKLSAKECAAPAKA